MISQQQLKIIDFQKEKKSALNHTFKLPRDYRMNFNLNLKVKNING